MRSSEHRYVYTTWSEEIVIGKLYKIIFANIQYELQIRNWKYKFTRALLDLVKQITLWVIIYI